MNKKIAHLSLSKFADLYADKLVGPDFFITDEKQLLSLSEYPYRSDGYIIGICTRGTAHVEVNLQVYEAKADAMLLATPFHILRIYNSSEDFLCRFIVFSKAFLTFPTFSMYKSILFWFSDPRRLLSAASDTAGAIDECGSSIVVDVKGMETRGRREVENKRV